MVGFIVPYSGILFGTVLRLGRRGLREWQFGLRIPSVVVTSIIKEVVIVGNAGRSRF